MAMRKPIVDLENVRVNFRNGHSEVIEVEEAREIVSSLTEFLDRNRGSNSTTFWSFSKRTRVLNDLIDSQTTSSHNLSSYNEVISKSKELPLGFIELHRESVNPKSSHHSTFIYAKNSQGVYGYKIVNGKVSPFFKLGRIEDPKSQIGGFLRAFPRNEVLVRTDVLQLRPFGVYEGRKIKALLDILTKLGYLAKTDSPIMEKRNAYGYVRTAKNDGLGGENNSDVLVTKNVAISPSPTRSKLGE